MNLVEIFRAGFVRRWHTNPDLGHTVDRIDGHSARVARIILALHPNPTLDLIQAALIHDDGESVVGDMGAVIKQELPLIAAQLASIENQATADLWGWTGYEMEAEHKSWLKFADRLDAFMWAAHHAPHIMDRDGWPEARTWLYAESAKLGCRDAVNAVVRGLG